MQLALEDIETALANRDVEEPQQNSTADKPADQRKKRRSNRGALPAHRGQRRGRQKQSCLLR
jgi:hypothetical protein